MAAPYRPHCGVGAALAGADCVAVVCQPVQPPQICPREALRLLPDVVGLLRHLAADRSLPRGVRMRLGLLLAYLSLPIDLVPDFIRIVGYAEDAIVVALALRSVVRRAGREALIRHWPGTTADLHTWST